VAIKGVSERTYSTEELIQSVEEECPGFCKLVDAEQAALHARYPDPVERRRFVLSHFVRIDVP
jgi:hypothetical protein